MVDFLSPEEKELLENQKNARAEEVESQVVEVLQQDKEIETRERIDTAQKGLWAEHSIEVFERLAALPENEGKSLIQIAYDTNNQYFSLFDEDQALNAISDKTGELRDKVDIDSILKHVRNKYNEEGRGKEFIRDHNEWLINKNYDIANRVAGKPTGKPGEGTLFNESLRDIGRLPIEGLRMLTSIPAEIGEFGRSLFFSEDDRDREKADYITDMRDDIINDPEVQSTMRHSQFLNSLNIEDLNVAEANLREEEYANDLNYSEGRVVDDIDGSGYDSLIPSGEELFASLREDLGIQTEEPVGVIPQFINDFKNSWNKTMVEEGPTFPLYDISRLARNMGKTELRGATSRVKGGADAAQFLFDLAAFGYGEKLIRYGLVDNLQKLSKSGVLIKMNEEIARLPNTMGGRFKARRIRNKQTKLQKIRTPEGLGGYKHTIDRDIRYVNYALGGGYLGLELMGLDVENGLGGAGALLLAGFLFPPVLTKAKGFAMDAIGEGGSSLKRLDLYLDGGGDLDEYLLKNPKFAGVYTAEDLKNLSQKDKLDLAKISAREFDSVSRFAKTLKQLEVDEPEIHAEMIANMKNIRKSKDRLLKRFDETLEDGLGTEDVEYLRDRFTMFLDQYVQSETLTAVRKSLIELPQLGKFKALNRKMIFSDLERIFQIERDQHEFLAATFLQLTKSLRPDNEVSRDFMNSIEGFLQRKGEDILQTEEEIAKIGGVQKIADDITTDRLSSLDPDSVWIGETELDNKFAENIIDETGDITVQRVDMGEGIMLPTGEALETLKITKENYPANVILGFTKPVREKYTGFNEAGEFISQKQQMGGRLEDVLINKRYSRIQGHFDQKFAEIRGEDPYIILENKRAIKPESAEEMDAEILRQSEEVGRAETPFGGIEVRYADDTTEIIPPVTARTESLDADNIRNPNTYSQAQRDRFDATLDAHNSTARNVAPEKTEFTLEEVSRETTQEGEILIRYNDDSIERIPPVERDSYDEVGIAYDYQYLGRAQDFGGEAGEGLKQRDSFAEHHSDFYSETSGRRIKDRYTQEELLRFEKIQNGESGTTTYKELSRKELGNGDLEITYDNGRVELIPDLTNTDLQVDPNSIYAGLLSNRIDSVTGQARGFTGPELKRFEQIQGGEPAVKQLSTDELLRRRQDVSARFTPIPPKEEEELLARLVEIEKDVTNLQKIRIVTGIGGVENFGVGQYLAYMRREYINTFQPDQAIELADYISIKIGEIQKTNPRGINNNEVQALIEAGQNLRNAADIGVFNEQRAIVADIFGRLEDAGVVVSANDLHIMAKQYRLKHNQFRGDSQGRGAMYKALEKQSRELLNTLFPDYRDLNQQYANEFFDFFEGGAYQNILELDNKGLRKIAPQNFINTFIDHPDSANSVRQLATVLNPTDFYKTAIGTTSAKGIASEREDLMELLFYNIGERMALNHKRSGGQSYMDANLNNFLKEGKSAGLFDGFEEQFDNIINADPINNAIKRETGARLEKLQSRLAVHLRQESRASDFKILKEFANVKTDRELALKLMDENTPEATVEAYIQQMATHPEYDMANYLYRNKKDITAGELKGAMSNDPVELVRKDLRFVLDNYMRKEFIAPDPNITVTRRYINKTRTPGQGGQGSRTAKAEQLLDIRLDYMRRVKFPELNEFFKTNKNRLKLLGYTDEHIDDLDKLTQTGIAIDKSKRFGVVDVPQKLTVPNILSRGWAIYRNVVGLRYVASDLSIRLFKLKEAEALDKLLSNPDLAATLVDVFEKGKPSPKLMKDAISAIRTLFTISATNNEIEGEIYATDDEIAEIILKSYIEQDMDSPYKPAVPVKKQAEELNLQ